MRQTRRGDLKNVIDSACVIRLDTGETQELSIKEASYCHFFEPIMIEGYKIIFRLDWSDLDTGGHPTLDADFYDIETNKKLPNIGKRRKAHHTNTKDPKLRVYEWEFKEIKWPFKVVVRWLAKIEEKVQFSDRATCEVYRNREIVDEVVVIDIQMPFGSMVVFMIKWAIAAIPAAIVLGAILLAIAGIGPRL